jgi:hypothetical protein
MASPEPYRHSFHPGHHGGPHPVHLADQLDVGKPPQQLVDITEASRRANCAPIQECSPHPNAMWGLGLRVTVNSSESLPKMSSSRLAEP